MVEPLNEQIRPRRGWLRVLGVGALSYFLGIIILVLTSNPILFPTVVMIGTFTVPVAYVAFFYERRHLSQLKMPATTMSFLYGGILGVFGAAVLEPLLIGELTIGSIFLVGFVEEFVKVPGILVIMRHRKKDLPLDGLILGAAAGMGFASLESNGYAFTAFLASHGSLSTSVEITLFRALISPIGHGTWTAILASVLFRESKPDRFRLSRKVLGAYLTVSILHGVWDGLPVVLTALTFPGLDILIGQAIVGAIGFLILARKWRESVRLQKARISA